jgi:hypothetical protein
MRWPLYIAIKKTFFGFCQSSEQFVAACNGLRLW